MPRRKSLSSDALREVLTKSARRCCVCFGLHNDKTIHAGQIAHIDGNRDNNADDNLAFLCLDHHNELDTRSSQSKGLTQIEVRHYRDNLHQYIAEIRNPKTPSSRLQGVWETWAGHKSITIQEVGAGVYRAHGIAVDNLDKEAPNLGLFDVISKGFSKEIVVRDGGIYINLKLEGNRLLAVDQSEFGSFGAGVTFNGNYEKSDKLVEAPEIDL